ncbi:hypothetical protein ACJX0J_021959 [Zea mays]
MVLETEKILGSLVSYCATTHQNCLFVQLIVLFFFFHLLEYGMMGLGHGSVFFHVERLKKLFHVENPSLSFISSFFTNKLLVFLFCLILLLCFFFFPVVPVLSLLTRFLDLRVREPCHSWRWMAGSCNRPYLMRPRTHQSSTGGAGEGWNKIPFVNDTEVGKKEKEQFIHLAWRSQETSQKQASSLNNAGRNLTFH